MILLIELSLKKAKPSFFLKKAISQISLNATVLQNKLSKIEQTNILFSKSNENHKKYIENSNNSGVQQDILLELERFDSNYIGRLVDKKFLTLNPYEVVAIISDHKFQGRRFLFLPRDNLQFIPHFIVKDLDEYGGKIIHSVTLNVDVTLKKLILLTQKKATDFALLKDINLRDWTIKFLGKTNRSLLDNTTLERINESGLTGCLNLFNTKLDKVIIDASFGTCEDTINIVNSSGNIKRLNISNASSDALDLDFSDLEIENIYVKNAGNDCIDVSGGMYSIKSAQLSNCGDKGLSVGEKSVLSALNINIEKSFVGASSKDFSKLVVKNSEFKSTKICLEAYQKKQEFGGALINYENFYCEGEFHNDFHSILLN